MIPHNIQQKLEEMAEKFSDKINGYENPDAYAYARKGHSKGASDLWQILTEGPLEIDEKDLHKSADEFEDENYDGRDAYSYRIGARYMFDQLKPKMMAMEAEIQRLREYEFMYKDLCK